LDDRLDRAAVPRAAIISEMPEKETATSAPRRCDLIYFAQGSVFPVAIIAQLRSLP